MDATHADLLTLCHTLQDKGLWLSLGADDALTLGPTALVKQHPALLAQVRTHKQALLHLLEDTLAQGVFGAHAHDPRFERETCPDCGQPCLVVLAPRRLGVHRLPGNKTVCPGSDRAQQAAVDTIMQAFLDDRCVARRLATLSWISLRGALTTWCLERTFFLPPRPFVLAWLDAHFDRHGDDTYPSWAGLTLTLREWGLDDDPTPAPASPSPPLTEDGRVPKGKLVLTA
jgi:hypothetical protein